VFPNTTQNDKRDRKETDSKAKRNAEEDTEKSRQNRWKFYRNFVCKHAAKLGVAISKVQTRKADKDHLAAALLVLPPCRPGRRNQSFPGYQKLITGGYFQVLSCLCLGLYY
jgi:hypothetical protein